MIGRFKIDPIISGAVPAFFVLTVLAISALGQDLPDKIRGYKVCRDSVSISVVPIDLNLTIQNPLQKDLKR